MNSGIREYEENYWTAAAIYGNITTSPSPGEPVYVPDLYSIATIAGKVTPALEQRTNDTELFAGWYLLLLQTICAGYWFCSVLVASEKTSPKMQTHERLCSHLKVTGCKASENLCEIVSVAFPTSAE